jgi:IS605 OrfB family transposase
MSDYAWTHKIFNQFRIHNGVYHAVRKSSKLAAQAVVRCISKVADSYKLDKKRKRVFRLLGAVTYDVRILSYSIDKRIASLWSVDGRLKIPFVCHNDKLLPYVKGEADLIAKNGKWYLFQTVEVPEDDVSDVEDFLGVDFGIVNLATTSDGKSFSGEAVDNTRVRIHTLKKALQKKGTPSARRHLKKLSGKERRFKRTTNHTIAKKIVQTAKDTRRSIVLEDLKGFRATVRKEQRERFGKWAFDELGRFITYKGKLAGVPVFFVDPRNTSRTCYRCGHVAKANRKSQSEFVCKECGFSIHADISGAKIIASRASVNRPIVAGASPRKRSVSNRVTSRLL